MGLRSLLVLGLTLALTTSRASAQKAEADAAFRRGKALMAKGQTAEACAEFETSMRLEPLSGTLYNLALCHEALGKIASAWSELTELAGNDRNAARAKDAARRAAALERQLTRMRIVVTDPAEGLVIKRDDVDVTALADKDIPVDPGRYTFVASAPGREDATVEVDLSAPGETIDVAIPALTPSKTEQPPDSPKLGELDPYADRITLRPLALPRRMIEARARLRWASSDSFGHDPIDTLLAGRMGLGTLMVRADIVVHTRYERDNMRPVLTESIGIGADYVISPLFVTGASFRKYHPLGGDIDQGYDFRADLSRKRIITPSVALVGTGGLAFESRKTRGSDARDAFQIVGDGIVQLSPMRHLNFEATARLRLDLGGELYGDTLLLDIGAGAVVVISRAMDAYITTSLSVLPSGSDLRVVFAGVTYRYP